MLLGDFKQEMMRLHNKVNMGLFGQGLRWQRVEIIQDKVFIIANNKRVTALTAIDHKDNMTTKLIDIALLVEFKERFLKEIEEGIGSKPLAVLKDYDPSTETSICIIIMGKDVEEVLKEI